MRVGLLGFGYWGERWARVLNKSDGVTLSWISDPDPKRLALAGEKYPRSVLVGSFRDYDELPETQGVVIATPPASHYELARQALIARRHVVLEKPITLVVREAQELAGIAEANRLVLTPGHTFIYSKPILSLLEFVSELGPIRHARFEWLGPGIFRPDVNVLWNVAPHALSILQAIIPGIPENVVATAAWWQKDRHPDLVNVTLGYQSGVVIQTAQITCSWVDPVKTRRITLIGSEGSIVCEPTSGEVAIFTRGKAREMVLDKGAEPLTVMLDDWVSVCYGVRPKTLVTAEDGVQSVRMLHLISSAIAGGATAGRVEHGQAAE